MPDRILSLLSHARSGGMLSDGDIHLLAEQAPQA